MTPSDKVFSLILEGATFISVVSDVSVLVTILLGITIVMIPLHGYWLWEQSNVLRNCKDVFNGRD